MPSRDCPAGSCVPQRPTPGPSGSGVKAGTPMTDRAAPMVKVQRVSSVAEARRFEELGADVIGIALRPEHGGRLFDDARALSSEAAEQIGKSLSRARLALALPDQADGPAVLDLARRMGAAYVEVPAFDLPGPEFRASLAAAGLGLIVSRVTASHDDDPGWLLTPVTELADPNLAWVEVELLAEHDNAWRFLTEASPAYPDELQLADIDALARESPLLVSINAEPATASAILAALPSCRGLSVTLGTLAPGRHDVHVHTPDQAAALLGALRSRH